MIGAALMLVAVVGLLVGLLTLLAWERWTNPATVMAGILIATALGWLIPTPIDFAVLGGSAQPIEVQP
jgi:hypothetical protein